MTLSRDQQIRIVGEGLAVGSAWLKEPRHGTDLIEEDFERAWTAWRCREMFGSIHSRSTDSDITHMLTASEERKHRRAYWVHDGTHGWLPLLAEDLTPQKAAADIAKDLPGDTDVTLVDWGDLARVFACNPHPGCRAATSGQARR